MNAPSKTSDADPRWIRTREAIIAAGKDLFGHHMAEGVSVDEIVKLARVSKQSFYNHFSDKDALGRELLRLARTDLDDKASKLNEGECDPAKRLATALCLYALESIRNPSQGELISRLLGADEISDAFSNSPVISDVMSGIHQCRLSVFTPEIGVSFILASGRAMVRQVLQSGSEAAAAGVSRQFVTLILRAFGLHAIEAEAISTEALYRVLGPAIVDDRLDR